MTDQIDAAQSDSDQTDSAQARTAHIAGNHGSEHRRAGRLRCEMLRCNIGTVVDMSATGMRVRVNKSRPPRWTTRTVKLRSLDGTDRVRVRKCWIRQIDDRCFELGLHFEDVTMEGRERLKDIARMAGVRFRLDSHSGAKKCA